jgi:hypothetical protein
MGPDSSLAKGAEVIRADATLRINDMSTFEATVIERDGSRVVLRQHAMQLGSQTGSFSASLYLSPPKGSVLLVVRK